MVPQLWNTLPGNVCQVLFLFPFRCQLNNYICSSFWAWSCIWLLMLLSLSRDRVLKFDMLLILLTLLYYMASFLWLGSLCALVICMEGKPCLFGNSQAALGCSGHPVNCFLFLCLVLSLSLSFFHSTSYLFLHWAPANVHSIFCLAFIYFISSIYLSPFLFVDNPTLMTLLPSHTLLSPMNKMRLTSPF